MKQLLLLTFFALIFAIGASAQVCGGCTYGPSDCSQCHSGVVQNYWPIDDANTVCLNCTTQPPVNKGKIPGIHIHKKKVIALKDGRTLEYIEPDRKRAQALNESGLYAKAVDNGSLMDLLAKSTGFNFTPTLTTKKFDHLKWVKDQNIDPKCAKNLAAFINIAQQVAIARRKEGIQ